MMFLFTGWAVFAAFGGVEKNEYPIPQVVDS